MASPPTSDRSAHRSSAETLAAVRALLRDVRLDAYMFEVHVRDEVCRVAVDYATPTGWRKVTLSVAHGRLFDALMLPLVRRAVLSDWDSAFPGARRVARKRATAPEPEKRVSAQPSSDRLAGAA